MVNFPINLQIGNLIVPPHLIFDILAFSFGFSLYITIRRKRKDFLHSEDRWNIILGGVIGALILSRLLASLENPYLFFNPPNFLYYVQGKTIVGGLIGAILGVEITKKILNKKEPTGDLFVFPLILGIAIGRMGCFLTGVSDRTVGLPSNLPWAISQGDGIPRHPTSLYEIIFLILLGISLFCINKRYNLKKGVLFKAFIIFYLVFRFIIEFIKPINPLFYNMSSIQITGFIMSIYYIKFLFKNGVVKNE